MQTVLRISGLLAALAALVIGLLTAALRAPTPRSYDIGASGDAYVAVNFYPPELDGVSGASFRWSGPAAALLLPDPYTGAAIIALRLHGNPDRSPLVLSSASSALPALTIQPDSGWRTYHILAPREQLWGASGQPCWLHLDGAAVGAQAAEPRLLGVAVDTLRVTPLTAVPGPLWPPLRRALLLGWGLILVAASLWCMLWSLGLRPLRTRTGRAVLLLPLLAAIGICLWAARDSASLSWVLPLSPVALSVATALLVALWAIAIWLRRERPRIVPRTWAITTAMVLGVAHLLLLLPSGIELRGVSALIILGVPGALLAHLLIPGMNDPLERLFLGLCGALALPVLLLLALQVVLPAAIAPLPLLVICDVLSVLAGALLARREPLPTTAPGEHPYLALAILLLYAAALRLPFLGRSELHDDEATAIVAATRMVGGIPDQLLIQLKGPVQVLLPAGPMALIGQINEWVARMPFLLAGMGVVLGGYVLARQVLGGRPAWGALAVAVILTCDGFLIAFSRIVQYQSVVMLMGIGAFWCCWRFYQGSARPWPDLIAAAIMMAVGLLSHYDAIYVVPALAWLVIVGGWRRGWRGWQWATSLVLPLVVGFGLLASFYVPFVLHPHFAETLKHISERSGQHQGTGLVLYNNLIGSYHLAIFYNTEPAVIAALAGLAVTLASALIAYVRPRLLGWLLAGTILMACADLLRGPGASLLMGNSWLAALSLGLPMIVLALSRATPIALRAPLIWFGVASLAVSFLLEQPRTHMHVMDVPAALLIGYGVMALGQARYRLFVWLRPGLAAAAAALVLMAAPYAYTLFIRQAPEYQRSFPMAVLPAYHALSAEITESPIGGNGRLGYPRQDGWKAIGELYRDGLLSGPFASNQLNEITVWYTRGMLRCNAEPKYYIIAMALKNPAIPAGYQLSGIVQMDGRNQLLIYSREPTTAPRIFDIAAFRSSFDAQPLPSLPLDCTASS